MDKIFCLKEDELLTKVKLEILKNIQYKIHLTKSKVPVNGSRSRSRNKKSLRRLATTQLIIQEKRSDDFMPSPYFPEIFRRNTVQNLATAEANALKANKYSPEVFGCINDWFMLIFQSALPINGAKLKNKEYFVHISNVKQFFLDLDLVLKPIYKKAIKPVKKQSWVSSNSFIACIEAIQTKVSMRNLKNLQTLIRQSVFELLFFFLLLQTSKNLEMSYDDLELVFKSAVPDCPKILIHGMLHRIFNELAAVNIKYEDFYKCLLGLL